MGSGKVCMELDGDGDKGEASVPAVGWRLICVQGQVLRLGCDWESPHEQGSDRD